jgi:ABC-type oligopeptide transport system ATPase subunit
MNYVYHRQGLDQLCDSTEKAYTALAESIDLLNQARQARSMSNVPQLFTEYKKEELVNIFRNHQDAEQRKHVQEILSSINPSQSTSWEKITKQ